MRQLTLRTALAVLVLSLATLPLAAQSGSVNINTASSEELERLPRVGPSVAQKIIDFRTEQGTFQQAEDLLLVQGIGEKTFELLRPFVSVSGETTLVEKVKVSELSRASDSS